MMSRIVSALVRRDKYPWKLTSPAVVFQQRERHIRHVLGAITLATGLALAPAASRSQTASPGPDRPAAASPGLQRHPAQPRHPPAVQAPAQPAAPVDRLVFATNAYCGTSSRQRKECRLGDTLFVGFSNLRQWMAASTNRPSDIVLVLNGRILKGVTSHGPDDTYSGLEFDLQRLDGDDPVAQANREAWNELIEQLRDDHTLEVAVASGGNPPFWGSTKLQFDVFPRYTWAVILFLIVLLIGFLLIARNSDILRDAPSSPGQPRQSYSLARCQMAWWFFIVAASFCYIWLILGNYDSLTAGVLILTGISAGTGLASTTIDSNKRDQRQALLVEEVTIEATLAALPGLIAGATPPQLDILKAEQIQKISRLAEVKASLASLPSEVGPSEGFLRDILRDETGISFHRFQMASWTVILGFVFVSAVYMHLSMPNFSPDAAGTHGHQLRHIYRIQDSRSAKVTFGLPAECSAYLTGSSALHIDRPRPCPRRWVAAQQSLTDHARRPFENP